MGAARPAPQWLPPGSDLGRAVAAAAARCHGPCDISLPAGAYTLASTLVLPPGIGLRGAGGGATRIAFTGTGPAIVVETGPAPGGGARPRDAIEGFALTGPGPQDGTSGVAVGLSGDGPDPAAVSHVRVSSVDIAGFGTAIQFRSGVSSATLFEVSLDNNGWGARFTGVSGAGVAIVVIASLFANNASGAVQAGGARWSFFGTTFSGGAGPTVVGPAARLRCFGCTGYRAPGPGAEPAPAPLPSQLGAGTAPSPEASQAGAPAAVVALLVAAPRPEGTASLAAVLPRPGPGVDIGAETNGAIRLLGCGEIILPPGRYRSSVSIVKPPCISLRGSGDTTIEYAGSRAAIVVYGSGESSEAPGGLADLQLVGPGPDGSSVGVYVGGDPAGSISPVWGQATDQTFAGVRVARFGRGYEFGAGVGRLTWLDGALTQNGIGLLWPGTIEGDGSQLSLFATAVSGSYGPGLDLGGGEWLGYGLLVSDNSGGGSPQITGDRVSLECFGCSIESLNGDLVVATGPGPQKVVLVGGRLGLMGVRGSDGEFLRVGGTDSALVMDGVELQSLHPVAAPAWFGPTGSSSREAISNLVLDGAEGPAASPGIGLSVTEDGPPTPNAANEADVNAAPIIRVDATENGPG
ncbi:MAG: hypothetical protein ACRDN0_07260, partial [Trebonia sp.]